MSKWQDEAQNYLVGGCIPADFSCPTGQRTTGKRSPARICAGAKRRFGSSFYTRLEPLTGTYSAIQAVSFNLGLSNILRDTRWVPE